MYFYDYEEFNDIRELALYMFFKEKKMKVSKKEDIIKVEDDNNTYNFTLNKQRIEAKYVDKKTLNAMFKYLYHRFGQSCFKRFKLKERKDIKRKIIEYPCEDFQKYKHRNVKFHYVCPECGHDVFTTWFLIDHFEDGLCKHCRKKKWREQKYYDQLREENGDNAEEV